MSPITTLPSELLLLIFRFVADGDEPHDRSLRRCSLVCHSWTGCARPLLYTIIDISWTSKRGASLNSAIDGDAQLLQQCKTLRVNFPRLDGWSDMHWEEESERERRWLAYLETLSPESRALLEDDGDAKRDYTDSLDDGTIRDGAIACAREEAREAGESGWMDEGPDGEAPRREGLRELFRLVRRLVGLRHLELSGIDWLKDGGDDPSPMDELPLLESLVSLGVSGGNDITPEIPALLARTPNIERLSINMAAADWRPLPPLVNDVVPNLKHLQNLHIRCEGTPGSFLGSIITLAHSTLRTISLAVGDGDFFGAPLALSLPQALLLDTLSLSVTRLYFGHTSNYDTDFHSSAPPLSSPFLAFLTQSSIRHLFLPCPPSRILLTSLPSSIISVQVNWPHTFTARYRVVDFLRQVIAAKQSRLTALARFKLVDASGLLLRQAGAKERALDKEEEELVRNARTEGLEIIFGDRERMTVTYMSET